MTFWVDEESIHVNRHNSYCLAQAIMCYFVISFEKKMREDSPHIHNTFFIALNSNLVERREKRMRIHKSHNLELSSFQKVRSSGQS